MLTAPVPGVEEARALVRSWRPDVLVDGQEPEKRVVLSGVSWEQYLAWDEALGNDRPGPRFYYLDEELEIMSTSEEHERIKTRIADCLTIYFDATGTEEDAVGQATMRSELRQAAEPDASWYLRGEQAVPDFVLEVALTSGGIRKLELYRHFGVSEVWFWRRGGLEVHALNREGSGYERVPNSRLLPDLDLSLLERCARMRSGPESRRAFRAGLAAGR